MADFERNTRGDLNQTVKKGNPLNLAVREFPIKKYLEFNCILPTE
ncbi:hypothetical protein [Neobacillus niacini]|nr:hypothetical protein [Neobacillus niacini]